MARFILKWRYLKPGAKEHNANLVRYIATRDGVDKIDDSKKLLPATKAQQAFIEQFLKDFPTAADSHEYQDYLDNKTRGTASEFISRAVEDNIDQIAKRENYVQYIAKRPHAEKVGTHGLFTYADTPINLKQVAEEVANHPGIVMTQVLSLRREDAARLSFDRGQAWRELIRGKAADMANAMQIPLDDLKWYAAFHNESHHPHCHIVAYSVGKQPYMKQESLIALKASFAREIFKQDRIQIYQQQTQYRDELAKEFRSLTQKIVDEINKGYYKNESVAVLMSELSEYLRTSTGKKQYGYLTLRARNLVNGIVDELERDSKIAELYELWYQQSVEIAKTYTNTPPKKEPLSQNKTFHKIKNIIVKEALNLTTAEQRLEELLPDDTAVPEPEEPKVKAFDEYEFISVTEEPIEQDTEPPTADPDDKSSIFPWHRRAQKDGWWSEQYLTARKMLYGTKEDKPDPEQAYPLMKAEAEQGNGLAMHDLGRMLLTGTGCKVNEAESQMWFASAYEVFLLMEKVSGKKDYWRYRIGKLYSYGYGVEQDHAQSAFWFTKAVAEENPYAEYALGGQYYRGQGVEQDPVKAFALYLKAANHSRKPNAYAMYQLGRMCEEGVGTEKDMSAAKEWYQKAYQGFLSIEEKIADDKLYYRLGSMNLSGIGTEVDLDLAKEYFEKAADLGNVDALYGLGKLYLNEDFPGLNPIKAVEYLEKAARKEHAYAQYRLGKMLLFGQGVPQDVRIGLRWLERSADQGNPFAQYLLGKTLLRGEYTDKNTKRAVDLLEQAILQGNIYAAYTLGAALVSGEDIPVNAGRGMDLLRYAAEKDYAAAQFRLAKVLLQGEIVPKDAQEAIQWLRKAVAQNNQYAQYLLGKMLLFGNDIEKDSEEAMMLLRASAAQGNVFAQRLLDNYGHTPVGLMCTRLMHHLARIFEEQQEENQKQVMIVDKKTRQKTMEKKMAHGQKMG